MVAKPTGQPPIFDQRDLRRARYFNRALNLLPRYHTGRRWNARLLNRLIGFAQYVVPDRQAAHSKVSVLEVPGISTTLHVLKPARSPKGMLLHFHGGAWVLGNARLDERLARPIAQDCDLVVAIAEFPNAVDDDLGRTLAECTATTEWLSDNLPCFGVTRLILSGESSGAHLAMESLLHLKTVDKHAAVAGFYSTCGAFDLNGSRSLQASSRRSLLLDGQSALANLQRLTPSLPYDVAQGPIHADLQGLPPALFIAGALDPIADDSVRMSRKWQQESGRADLLLVPDAPHGFNRFPTSLAAKVNRFGRQWMRRLVDDGCGI